MLRSAAARKPATLATIPGRSGQLRMRRVASTASQFGGDTARAMSKETLSTLRRGYEAFNRGDTSSLAELARELATPDVEWGATGAFPGVEGMYRGPEAIEKWMGVIRSAWEEFEASIDEVLDDRDDVLVVAELLRGRGRGSGVEVEMRIFSVYWFETGKIRKRAAFTERSEAFEAAGLSD
jgi:ketosteroid isomerase-like protein